ncbi:MAG: transglycosylase SLT domain-containing protein [Gammaproteobacteria bacterium]|nr:transglycosylase SLT domain-containing protein [Gammaproteobacteria bacterium]
MQFLKEASVPPMTVRFDFMRLCFFILALSVPALLAQAASATELAEVDRQRQVFKDVIEPVEQGDWGVVEKLPPADNQLLRQYVLWPDLKATYWRATMKQASTAEIDAFLTQYGALRPARELRYRLALHLANSGNLDAYQQIYERFYHGQDIAKLDCLSLQAELDAGRHNRVNGRAIDLWLLGKSQVSECDPVFEYLDENKLLGPVEYRKRYELAIEAREFKLARWLAKKIDQQHVEDAALWTKAQANPEDFLTRQSRRADNVTAAKQVVYAVERLTFRDPVLALSIWKRVSKRSGLSEEQRHLTARHIALWTARDNLAGAYDLLLSLPKAAADDEVLRWRARTSLRNTQWNDLLVDIAMMSHEERDSEEWQYWRAVALERSGQVLAAREAFQELGKERSYYGFLAADELGQHYQLDHSQLQADEAVISAIAARPEIIRARELFLVGQDGRGRSEWDAVVHYFSPQEKLQAAILANRWGWHSRAISTAASLGEYDDLSIRYPLPYQQLFEQSSSKASISPTWAYGIARSESLFMRDVRSHAGAVGLMQLMPATGRDVARDIHLPYSGLRTLTDPESNIRLGTSYLGQMAERYSGNPVLATAAYNAGPHRVDRWLPDSGTIDARIWIENIPFNETRKYVKRVLSAQAIFHWRMTGQVRRLSDELSLVKAAGDEQQLAFR